jgi:hypothetical protein
MELILFEFKIKSGTEEINGHSSRIYALKYHPADNNLLIR